MQTSEFIEALAGPSPAKAAGLASMVTGAAGAALFLKCRYQHARSTMDELQELAAADGDAFAGYLQARRDHEPVEPWLRRATESPLTAASLCLDLADDYPAALDTCPGSMLADLQVGRTLLLAAAQGCLLLVEANLALFPQPWVEGEAQLAAAQQRLQARPEKR